MLRHIPKIGTRRQCVKRLTEWGVLATFFHPLFNATASPRRLKVVTIAIAPYGALGPQGVAIGAFPDVLHALQQECGFQHDNRVVPFARAVAMIGSGEADLMISLLTRQLSKVAYQIGPVIDLDIVIVGRAGHSYQSYRDLRGKRVGVVRGTEYDPVLTSDTMIDKHEINGLDLCVRQLREQRVDAIVCERYSLYCAMLSLGFQPTEFSEPTLVGERQTILHYSKVNFDPTLAATLKAALARLRRQGTPKQLLIHQVARFTDHVGR